MSRTKTLKFHSWGHITGHNTTHKQITGISLNNNNGSSYPEIHTSNSTDDEPARSDRVMLTFNAAEVNIRGGSTCSSATLKFRYSRSSMQAGAPTTDFTCWAIDTPIGVVAPSDSNTFWDLFYEEVTVPSGVGTYDSTTNIGVKEITVTSAVNDIISKDTYNEQDLCLAVGLSGGNNAYRITSADLEVTWDDSSVDADTYRYTCDNGHSWYMESNDTDDIDILSINTSKSIRYISSSDDDPASFGKAFLTFPIDRSEVVSGSDIESAKLILHGGRHNSSARGVVYGAKTSDVYSIDLFQGSSSYSSHNSIPVTTNKGFIPASTKSASSPINAVNYLFEVDVKDLLVEYLNDATTDDDYVLLKLEVPSSGTGGGSGSFVINTGSRTIKNTAQLIVKTTAGSGSGNGKVSSGGGGGGGTSSPTFYNPFNSKAIQ